MTVAGVDVTLTGEYTPLTACKAIKNAKLCLEVQNIQGKVESIQKAIRIIDEGLAASLDVKAGGEFAERLLALYDYMAQTLVQSNARNDSLKMDEVVTLLSDLRQAWQEIGQAQSGGQASASIKDSLSA